MEGIKAEVTFEVFNSRGKWDFLFSKTLLKRFKAIHDSEQDEILIRGSGRLVTLHNQAHIINQNQSQMKPNTPVSIVIEEHQHDKGDESMEIKVETLKKDVKLFTRMNEPHKPERVQELL